MVRHGFELASAITLVWQFVGSLLVGAIVAVVANLSWPLRVLIGLLAFVIVLGAVIAAYGSWRNRRDDAFAPAPPSRTPRIGIKNSRGGRSMSEGATFGGGLDTAIDNSEGGESEDRNSTFH